MMLKVYKHNYRYKGQHVYVELYATSEHPNTITDWYVRIAEQQLVCFTLGGLIIVGLVKPGQAKEVFLTVSDPGVINVTDGTVGPFSQAQGRITEFAVADIQVRESVPVDAIPQYLEHRTRMQQVYAKKDVFEKFKDVLGDLVHE